MNAVSLGTLNCGDSFSYAGYDWTIIYRDWLSNFYCLCDRLIDSRDIVKGGVQIDTSVSLAEENVPFDEFLFINLLDHFIAAPLTKSSYFCKIERDFTADDGTKSDIKNPTSRYITLLTADEYRIFRKYISAPVNQVEYGYFTITPWSYSETIYKNDWVYVMPNGVLTFKNSADMDADSLYTFRPTICLNRDAMVTVNKVTEEEIKRITDQFNAIEDKYGYDGCKYLLDTLNRMYNNE